AHQTRMPQVSETKPLALPTMTASRSSRREGRAMSTPVTRRRTAVLDEASRRTLQRRSLTVVVISQVFGGAGLAAGVTVGALLAQDMLGGAALAGLPAALFTLGSALAA